MEGEYCVKWNVNKIRESKLNLCYNLNQILNKIINFPYNIINL